MKYGLTVFEESLLSNKPSDSKSHQITKTNQLQKALLIKYLKVFQPEKRFLRPLTLLSNCAGG